MAVTHVRALLAAHAQTGWNRALRELGRGGAIALIAGVAALGLFALLPMVAGLAFAGWLLGRSANPWAPVFVGGLLTLVSVGGGLLGGILGGSKSLAWERLRAFPLRRGEVFAAELVAGLGDLLTGTIAAGLLAFCLGLAAAHPARSPFALLLLAESLMTLLSVQLVVGGLASALLRHLKTALFVLLGLLWVASVALSSPRPRSVPPLSVTASTAAPALPSAAARLTLPEDRLLRAAAFLPAVQGARSLGDPSLARGAARHLPALALAGLLAWLASTLLWRESLQDATSLALSARQARLWSFSRPIHGLARLQLRTLAGSMIGRFAFLIPVMAVVLLKGPLAGAETRPLLAVPGAFIYLAFSATQLLFNQFGLDQGAAKGLLMLPVSPKELLLGKALGHGAFLGLQALLLALLLAVFGGPGLAPALPAGLALFAACALAMGIVGMFTSVAMPRPLSRTRLGSGGMPLVMVLVSMGASLGCAALFGGLFAALAWLAPAWLLPGMLLAAAAMVLVFRAGLEAAGAYLVRHRERLVERLG